MYVAFAAGILLWRPVWTWLATQFRVLPTPQQKVQQAVCRADESVDDWAREIVETATRLWITGDPLASIQHDVPLASRLSYRAKWRIYREATLFSILLSAPANEPQKSLYNAILRRLESRILPTDSTGLAMWTKIDAARKDFAELLKCVEQRRGEPTWAMRWFSDVGGVTNPATLTLFVSGFLDFWRTAASTFEEAVSMRAALFGSAPTESIKSLGPSKLGSGLGATYSRVTRSAIGSKLVIGLAAVLCGVLSASYFVYRERHPSKRFYLREIKQCEHAAPETSITECLRHTSFGRAVGDERLNYWFRFCSTSLALSHPHSGTEALDDLSKCLVEWAPPSGRPTISPDSENPSIHPSAFTPVERDDRSADAASSSDSSAGTKAVPNDLEIIGPAEVKLGSKHRRVGRSGSLCDDAGIIGLPRRCD